jgi:hypothetical protein
MRRQCIAVTHIESRCSRNCWAIQDNFCSQHRAVFAKNPMIKTIHNSFFIMDSLRIYHNPSDPNVVFKNCDYGQEGLRVHIEYGVHINQYNKIIIHKLSMNEDLIFKINAGIYKYIKPAIQHIIFDIFDNLVPKLGTSKDAIEALKKKNKNIKSRSPDDTCGICWEVLGSDKKVTTSCCRQVFCDDCLLKTINIKNCCPLCRKDDFIKL